MTKAQKRHLTRRGFTLLELLVVISIIAVIATFATGAAMKSIKQSRVRRVQTMAKGLELALENYRAKENKWPFTLSDCVVDPKDKTRYWIHGPNNKLAFKKLYHGQGGGQTIYLDAAAYLTNFQGKRMPLRTALNLRQTDVSLGYPQPDNTSRFCFYCVCYSPLTDTVKVVRQDQKHEDVNGAEFECTEWDYRR